MFDSRVSLQMATDADRVPPFGVELERVDHGSFAGSRDMQRRVTMTALASDGPMEKRQTLKVIARTWVFPLHATHVTTHAPSRHRQRRWHGRESAQPGVHVVRLRLGVVGHGRL